MITHDLGVVANIAQKIAVMYSGIIVESGTCEDIFYRPRHPYTWALIRSVPRLDLKNKQELATIPGTPPDLLNPPVGCPFCTRCSYCMPICKEEMPEVTEFGGEHKAACWLHHPMSPSKFTRVRHLEWLASPDVERRRAAVPASACMTRPTDRCSTREPMSMH